MFLYNLMKNYKKCVISLSFGVFLAPAVVGQVTTLIARMDKTTEGLEPKVISWRRDFHQHPELGNREFQTAAKISTF